MDAYQQGYSTPDKPWLAEIIQAHAGSEDAAARRLYREVYRAAWDAWARRGVSAVQLENKARRSANTWLRGYLLGHES